MDNGKKTLTLPLKRKWFDLIKSGVKKEEYRELKDFYHKRFGKGRKFDELVFTLGYPKGGDTDRVLVFKNPKIRIGAGNEEWGAESGKEYYVITWDDND